ncbi:MAG TPA: tryptophan--tRNA ligase [Solirubrobacteraceae bacterium]|nr:tryptophan--tRNA ligase [Solirubrobacteraceae bacterium]
MSRIVSGIQPTGSKHLGNFIGAITRYVALQDSAAAGEALYFIADLHATTVPYAPADLRRGLYDLAALLLASGLDPDHALLFRQSDVPEHAELQWLLTGVTSYGELGRMTQFKDKSAKQEFVSAGLFTYPVLMAADVLVYRARRVPVGDDQTQHVELMRNLAERFNARFGPQLVVPEGVYPEVGARIMDLQEPTRKMSTTGGSPQGTVLVLDEPAVILKKFRSAVTDSGREIHHDRAVKPGVSNLLEIYAAVRGITIAEAEAAFADARGYGDLKTGVGEAVVAYLAPVRERYESLRADEAELEAVLADGARRARELAGEVMADVRAAMGVGPLHARAPGAPAA